MKEKLMVLKVKLNENSRFQVKYIARLLNNEEMEKFGDMVSAYVSCGCEIKVEMKEMEL